MKQDIQEFHRKYVLVPTDKAANNSVVVCRLQFIRNYIRHFIKTPFIKKVIDFIDLPSIFRDNTIESSIPDYFENKEPSIICYKYNKPIKSTIFNVNRLVANLDIDTKTPDS